MEHRLDLHPLFLQQAGPFTQATLAAASALIRSLAENGPPARTANDKQTLVVALIALALIADAGGTIEACRFVLDIIPAEGLTPAERYQMAESFSRVGRNHRQKREFERAIEIYRAGLAFLEGLPARPTTSALYHNMAVAYEGSGDHAAAAEAFAQSADVEALLGREQQVREARERAQRNRQASAKSNERLVLELTAEGAKARQLGKMSTALQRYLLAQQHAYRSRKPSLISVVALGLCGIYFYQREYDRARDVLVTALQSVEPQGLDAAQLRVHLGVVLAALRDPGAATAYQETLEAARANRWDDLVDLCEYGLAQLALKAEEYTRAEQMLRPVLARRRKARTNEIGRTVVELGNALNQLGVAVMGLGRVDEALAYHTEALSVRRGYDARGCAESTHSLGYLHESAGRARRALAYYLRTVRYHESIRREIGTGADSRASFLDGLIGDYFDAARCACELARVVPAWYALQRVQNRTLLDGLARAAVDRPADVPADQFHKEAALLDRLNERRVDEWVSHDVLMQLASLYRQMDRVAPDFVRWRTGQPMTSRRLLQALDEMGPGTAYVELVDFVWKNDRGRRAELFGVRARAGDRALRTLHAVTQIGSAGAVPADRARMATSAEQVMTQISDVLGGPGHLLLVPHGLLANLPLQTIAVGGRPLIESQAIRFLPHAGLIEAQRWLPRTVLSSATVLGDSRRDLPGARAEAVHVARLLEVMPRLGHEVTREAIAQALQMSDLVHIAGHAYFDRTDPMRSGIMASDGVFTAETLLGRKAGASIVILNACESGVQGAGTGNELHGFVRALLLSGVRHIVCTLETVDDAVAREFAEEIYGRLRGSASTAIVDAVWHAQRTLARRHALTPRHWRSFILVG